jgi:uncharacterized protein YbjT (DUF2867 family)
VKIVVVGGSGRIGSKLVDDLRQADCRVFAASPTYGVDTVTGRGLADALAEAEVVVDVTNAPALDGDAPLRFFETSGRNLLAAARAAGVRRHIALSIVGADGLLASPYFRAKKIQEEMIAASGIPFTIVRSTQFFEFIRDVVQAGTAREIPISPALVQQIAVEDVADTLGDAVFGDPLDGVIEVAGPEQFGMDAVAAEIATAFEDTRRIVADRHARYFGAELEDRSLLPGSDARIAALRFDDWLRRSLQPAWALAAETRAENPQTRQQ